MPLTVLIPTYNEARNLPDCLKSVAWADEIFVVDSFSSDATVEIAKQAGARVVQHEYLNSAAQKNWAIPQAKHEWVLIVDADERVTPQLAEEIKALMAAGAKHAAYSIFRRTFFFDIEIKRCGWDSDSVIRLFDRSRARYPDQEVHANMLVDGPIGTLAHKLDHYTYRTFDEYFEKFRRYTTWSANDQWKRGKRASFGKILFRPLGRFLKMYVLRRGFLDGVPGLIVCCLAAISVFTRYAKLWAMQRAVDSGAKFPDGRPVIHAGAAILPEREVISGGKHA